MSEFVVIIDWETREAHHIKFDDPVSVQQFLETILELGTLLEHSDDSWAVLSKGPSNDMQAVKFIYKNGSSLMTYQRLN